MALDTLLWGPAEASGLEVEVVTRGAERYRQRAFAHSTGGDGHAQSPRAPEEMALWHVEERRRLLPTAGAPPTASDTRARSLVRRARREGGHEPADLARLADLALAAGEIDRSVPPPGKRSLWPTPSGSTTRSSERASPIRSLRPDGWRRR